MASDPQQKKKEEIMFVEMLRIIHPSLATWARAQIRDDGRTVAQVKQRLGEIIERSGRT